MKNVQKNADGDIQKLEAVVYYNHKMGGIDSIELQLLSTEVLRKTYRWYQNIFRMLKMALSSSHKLYKGRGNESPNCAE